MLSPGAPGRPTVASVKLAAGLVDAQAEAFRLLAADDGRWNHVRGVANAASRAVSVAAGDREVLVAAAWLHDIGYAEAIVDTGLHQLDGARYLRSIGAPERLCRLVANHTAAWAEASARGLGDVLAEEFPPERSFLADALTYADLTTSPAGLPTTIEDRLADIFERYEPGHVVHESIRQAAPELIATVRRVEVNLAAHG